MEENPAMEQLRSLMPATLKSALVCLASAPNCLSTVVLALTVFNVFCVLVLVIQDNGITAPHYVIYFFTSDFSIVARPWTEWGSWELCSASCGGGVRPRYRKCLTELEGNYKPKCEGSNVTYSDCNELNCKPCKHNNYLDFCYPLCAVDFN